VAPLMAGQPPARDSFKGPPSGGDKIMPFFLFQT